MIIGVDEAGRGPLAGCVVACALYIKSKVKIVRGASGKNVLSFKRASRVVDIVIKDSKKLSAAQREIIFEEFRHDTVFSVGIATHKEIDEYNILKATFIAFERAISDLLKKAPHLKKPSFIIDGNSFKTRMSIDYKCVVKADEKIPEVAFASIVAKLFRDYLMGVADLCFPQWCFSKHKGYPTREHVDSIKKYSISPLHRRSFAPCQIKERELITNQKQQNT